MSSITVTNVGKAYRHYTSRWARIAEWLLPGKRSRHELKWVLQEINFTVQPGEAVGLVGINGAGKSTLLKMITGTTQPTVGSIQISGRVAALLELGMGFHPDFTGRENVFMAGQLLGYTVEEIHALMPFIEEFAEIGDYIDMPVRVYSSGMHVRLAFSVATAKRPDVLIVDEALSVGDSYYQHKSFDRIKQFSKEGTTLLIVSHSREVIQSVCNYAILLNKGGIASQGKPDEVMDFYNALIAEQSDLSIKQEKTNTENTQTISGNGLAFVQEVALLNEQDEKIEVVEVGQIVKLKIVIAAKSDISELTLGYMIKDKLGQPIFGTNTHHLSFPIQSIKQETTHTCIFKFAANLGPGSYSVSTALHTGETHLHTNYEWKDIAYIFNVMNNQKKFFVGSAWLPPSLEVVE